MFIGAQVSLYPMSSDFISIITGALAALQPWRQDLRIETDDISTLMVGPPAALFPAIRDLFTAAARNPAHVTLHATLSRGCPGEPDDLSCHCGTLTKAQGLSLADRQAAALQAVQQSHPTGVEIDLQFSLYVMGTDHHMTEIYGCIEFLKSSGTFLRSKNFCTRLRGDSATVFATLQQAFLQFGPAMGHVTIDLTASANSPSLR